MKKILVLLILIFNISISFGQYRGYGEYLKYKNWRISSGSGLTMSNATIPGVGSFVIVDTIGVGKDFATIQEWYDAYQDTNLVDRDIILKGILTDTLYTYSAAPENYAPLTDSTHYYWLVGNSTATLRYTGVGQQIFHFNGDILLDGINFDGNSVALATGVIYLYNNISTGRHRIEVRRCKIYNGNFYDIAGDFMGLCYIYMRQGTVLLYNNALYDFTSAVDLTSTGVETGYCGIYINCLTARAEIYNNTIANIGYSDDLTAYGIYLDPVTSLIAIIKNNVCSNIYALNGIDTAYGYTSKATITATNNASYDSKVIGTDSIINLSGTTFIDSTFDFRLWEGSSLIDAGVTIPYFTTDMLGTTRVAPWDIGAYEGGIPDTVPPIAGTFNQTVNPIGRDSISITSFGGNNDLAGIYIDLWNGTSWTNTYFDNDTTPVYTVENSAANSVPFVADIPLMGRMRLVDNADNTTTTYDTTLSDSGRTITCVLDTVRSALEGLRVYLAPDSGGPPVDSSYFSWLYIDSLSRGADTVEVDVFAPVGTWWYAACPLIDGVYGTVGTWYQYPETVAPPATNDSIIFYWECEDSTAEKYVADSTLSFLGGIGLSITHATGDLSLYRATASDYAELTSTNNINYSQGRLGFWLNLHTIVSGTRVFRSQYDTSNRMYITMNTGGTLTFNYTSGSAAEIVSSGTITLDTWTWVEVKWDVTANTYQMWFDNVSQGTSTTDVGLFANSPVTMWFGETDSDANVNYIDHVLISDRTDCNLYNYRNTTEGL